MGSKFFIILTIQDNRNMKYTLSYTEVFGAGTPEEIFDTAFAEACNRYSVSPTSASVIYFNFYKA